MSTDTKDPQPVYVKLKRVEGYEDVSSELLIEDACINAGFEPEDATAEINRLTTELAAAEKLAADRLEQMQLDRKQALAWRDELAALRERLEAAELGAQRYETLRLFNAAQFTDAFVLNRRTGKPFDEIVDDMRPFMFPAMSASTE